MYSSSESFALALFPVFGSTVGLDFLTKTTVIMKIRTAGTEYSQYLNKIEFSKSDNIIIHIITQTHNVTLN
jgi:hypothetical protein